jgi:hypothetical protein
MELNFYPSVCLYDVGMDNFPCTFYRHFSIFSSAKVIIPNTIYFAQRWLLQCGTNRCNNGTFVIRPPYAFLTFWQLRRRIKWTSRTDVIYSTRSSSQKLNKKSIATFRLNLLPQESVLMSFAREVKDSATTFFTPLRTEHNLFYKDPLITEQQIFPSSLQTPIS